LTSHSGSLASNFFWPEIWGDLVKISHGKQRERTNNSFLKILNSVYKYPSAEERKKIPRFF
jgi:hypothetical protein